MKSLLVYAALVGGMWVSAGCQMSDNHRVYTSNRPSDYDRAYVATKDTDWKASQADNAAGGTVSRGTTVYFDHVPNSSLNWQQARVTDGNICYVRPADFTSAK